MTVYETVEINVLVKNLDKANKGIQGMRKQFDMTALSLLFFGMQMKRVTESIARSSVDAFMKISEGVGRAGEAITSLGAGFTFLKFEVGRAIGEALAPLMPFLLRILSWASDFVQKHPKGVAGLLFGGIAVGTILLIVGSIGTLVSSLTGVSIAEAVTSAAALGTALGVLAKIGLVTVGVGFTLATLSDIAEGKWGEAIADALIAGGGFLAIANPVAGGALVAMGIGMKLLGTDEILQETVMFFAQLMRILAGVVKVLISVVAAPLEVLLNSAIGVYNLFSGKHLGYVSLSKGLSGNVDSLIAANEQRLVDNGTLPDNSYWGKSGVSIANQNIFTTVPTNAPVAGVNAGNRSLGSGSNSSRSI